MIVLIVLGYVLLSVFAVILSLTLMVMVIPFKYLSSGSAFNMDGDAVAELKWFFNAVGVKIRFAMGYQPALDLRVGFLHFSPCMKSMRKKDDRASVEKNKKGKNVRFTKGKLIVLLDSIKRVLKRFMPRRLMIDAVIGFDDAYYTGLLCSGLSLAEPLICSSGNEVRIVPEFNDAVFEGSYRVEGRVVVFFLVWEALRIFFSKPFRTKR